MTHLEYASGFREHIDKHGEHWCAKDADRCGLQNVISLELLTVLVVGPLACLVCHDIAKKNPRANILMTVIATAELYGGMSDVPGAWRLLRGKQGALTRSQAS